MAIPIIGGLVGGSLAARLGFAATTGNIAKTFVRSPLVQGGTFGVGYTGGAYTGYGITNTSDVFGIHKPKYKRTQQSLGLPYGSYGYGRRSPYSRRRYRRRYGRYTRRSRYGYRRRSYYRRYY